MSGSSGGYSDNFPSASVTACDQLVFVTQLASPKEEVIGQLNAGDTLEIVSGEQHGQSVVHAMWQGQVAGGIADQRLQQLRQCLAAGTMYSATVLSINNGQVRINVFPITS